MILAIDPGPEKSAFVEYQIGFQCPVLAYGILPNQLLLGVLSEQDPWPIGTYLTIEWVESYGAAVGQDVFQMVAWIGRFEQAFGGETYRITSKDCRRHLCHNIYATKAQVRQTLLDRFGPGREKAVGTKKSPGPLYGIKTHLWSALAVAVTFAETRELKGVST